jgi:hypothetical protein
MEMNGDDARRAVDLFTLCESLKARRGRAAGARAPHTHAWAWAQRSVATNRIRNLAQQARRAPHAAAPPIHARRRRTRPT